MLFYIIFITTDYKLRSSEGVLAALPDIDNLLDYGDCLFFFSLEIVGHKKSLGMQQLETYLKRIQCQKL